jgi:large subunit ribosomal protein L10
MSANIEAKKQVCAEIEEKIKASKSVVFVSYKGLSVAEDTELRSAFRKQDVEYKVLKNTLIKKAFDAMGIKDFDNDLNGPTAVAFAKDETSAAKILVDATKKYADKITLKSAYVDGAYVDANGIKALSAIPSKPELYAMLAGTLNNMIASLAIAIKAVADKQGE